MKALKNVYQMMITSMKEAKGTFSVTFPEQSRSSAARPVSPLLLNKQIYPLCLCSDVDQRRRKTVKCPHLAIR